MMISYCTSPSGLSAGIMMSLFFFLSLSITFIRSTESDTSVRPSKLSEKERVELWHKLGNTWPPNWQQETEGYLRTQEAREKEIMLLTGGDERWENWMQYVQSRLVPRFTENGFDIIDTPRDIHAKLQAAVKAATDGNFYNIPDEEGVDDAIYGPYTPKFIDLTSLGWQIIEELKELHEKWAGGMKLVATSAYGVRLYRNGSSLVMHHDKIETHVISSIVHIAHKYDNDSEPWPIQIEDHDGNMHSAVLKEGQMLFYESTKCLHGRMKTLKGQYYGSIFLHYKPVDNNIWPYDVESIISSVPPHWRDGIVEDRGSRWAGQAITVDSVAPAGAPPRVVQGELVHENVSPHSSRDEL